MAGVNEICARRGALQAPPVGLGHGCRGGGGGVHEELSDSAHDVVRSNSDDGGRPSDSCS